jgi:cytoskeletal protein CcmA (bactofilin family)
MFGKTRSKPTIKLTQLSSLVAEGVEVEGDVVFRGGLRIDGRVRGKVSGRSGDGEAPALLVLSHSGRIEGRVHCGNALINGTVDGDVEVEHYVELQAGARVTGTLRYRQLQVDVGAVVQGQLVHADGSDAAAASPTAANVVEFVPEPQAAGERR